MVVRETSLTVRCPTENGETLAVSGSSDSLGCWRKSGLVHMVKGEGDLWHASLSVDLDLDDVEVSYRYAIVVGKPPPPPTTKLDKLISRGCLWSGGRGNACPARLADRGDGGPDQDSQWRS